MKLYGMPLGALGTNCYIVASEDTQEALIVDPGASPEFVSDVLKKYNLKPVKILLTHGHADHISGVQGLVDEYNLPVYINEADIPYLEKANGNYNEFVGAKVNFTVKPHVLAEGDEIECGEIKLKVIATPGHTPGGICFYGNGILLAGDTLFQNSVGRTDLPGGSMADLISNIKNKLFTLPPETTVYPGHGPSTSIAWEKENNPFIY